MTDSIYDLLKYIINGTLLALASLLAYFGKSIFNRVSVLERDKLEQDKIILSLESKLGTRVSVMESQVRDIQLDIKEIKEGINKLIDKLL